MRRDRLLSCSVDHVLLSCFRFASFHPSALSILSSHCFVPLPFVVLSFHLSRSLFRSFLHRCARGAHNALR